MLVGTDFRATALHSSLQAVLGGQAQLLAAPGSVLVGPRTGFGVGDRIRLQDADVTVAGVLDGPEAARFDGGAYVVAPLELAQRAANKAGDKTQVLLKKHRGGDGVVVAKQNDFAASRRHTSVTGSSYSLI